MSEPLKESPRLTKTGRAGYKSRRGKYQNCLICQRETYHTPKEAERGNGKYCSWTCAAIGRRKDKPADPQYARQFLKIRGLVEKCSGCGYCEHSDILGVHHKDENRMNNSLDNLEVLCPTCHSMRHRRQIRHTDNTDALLAVLNNDNHWEL